MEDKKKHFKSLNIIEKGNGLSAERKIRRNQQPLEIEWNFEAICRTDKTCQKAI